LIQDLNPTTHVFNERYVVSLLNVQEFLVSLVSWVEGIINEVEEVKHNELRCDVGLIFVVACERIDSIRFQHDAHNNSFVDPYTLLSVLPRELVKTSTSDFFRKMRQHGYQLQHRYSSGQIDLAADEHKALIHAHRHEPVLKQGIDALTGKSSFVEGWSLLGACFPNLIDYCGIVVTLFLGTSTLESDFSVLRWEKDELCKALSDFGLEGVLQTKQYLVIEQLLESN
jgi:hypothetical protein